MCVEKFPRSWCWLFWWKLGKPGNLTNFQHSHGLFVGVFKITFAIGANMLWFWTFPHIWWVCLLSYLVNAFFLAFHSMWGIYLCGVRAGFGCCIVALFLIAISSFPYCIATDVIEWCPLCTFPFSPLMRSWLLVHIAQLKAHQGLKLTHMNWCSFAFDNSVDWRVS